MDSNNYEQEFIKNVKRVNQPTPSSRSMPKTAANNSVLPLVISIILAFIVLIESIALAIFAVNYGETLDLYGGYGSGSDYEPADDSPESLSEASNYTYDDNYNIIAFNLSCTAKDGSKYTFTKSKTYQKTDASSSAINSGTYSIIGDSVVVLNNSNNAGENKTVYYDGYDIIEGTTFYTCEDETTEQAQ